MNVKKEISPEQDATVEVEVPAEETASKFAEALSKFQREARIPGFRPGKAPLAMVRQRWGKAIETETAEDLAREYMGKALEESGLAVGGRINLNLLEYGEGKPLRFKVAFPVRPDVKLSLYKGLRITLNHADVTEEDVDAQIESLRRKNAVLKPIDGPATAEAHLQVRAQEVDHSGLPLIGRKVEDLELEFGADRLGIGSDEQLLGIRAGDKRLIRIKEAAHDPRENPVQIFKPGSEDQTGKPKESTLSVEVLSVKVPDLPAVDAEFAKVVEPSLASVEAMRQHIKTRLMDFVAFQSRHHLDHLVVDRLVEDNPFPVARGVIQSSLEVIADQVGVKPEERTRFIEEHFAEAERDFRWVKLRDEIARAEGIAVTDSELDQELVRLAEATGKELATVQKEYAAGDARERLKGRIFEGRVVDFLLQHAAIDRRPMSLQEFIRTQAGH